MLLFSKTQDHALVAHAQETYRSTIIENADVTDPDLEAWLVYLLSAEKLQETTLELRTTQLNDVVEMDKSVLTTFTKILHSKVRVLLEQQLGLADCELSSFGNEAANLHSALDAFVEAEPQSITSDHNQYSLYFQAKILGRLADIEKNIDEESRSNDIFSRLVSTEQAQRKDSLLVTKLEWGTQDIHHATTFRNINDVQQGISILQSALAASDLSNHALRAKLHSAIASGFLVLGQMKRNGAMLKAGIAEHRDAILDLKAANDTQSVDSATLQLSAEITKIAYWFIAQGQAGGSTDLFRESIDIAKNSRRQMSPF